MDVSRRSLIQLGGAGCGVMAMSANASPRGDQISVLSLRICGLEAPLALGGRQPRFSWMFAGPGKAVQAAYRITVARSKAELDAGKALVWDSGRIASSASFDIPYGGPTAPARARLWWRVEAWAHASAGSARSSAIYWETGLAGPSDWSAAWLACETETARLDREAGIHWIASGASPRMGAQQYFRGVIIAEHAGPADLLISANRLDGVWLNGDALAAEGEEPVSWTAMATYPITLAVGRNVVAAAVTRMGGFGAAPPALAAIVRLNDARGRSVRLTSASGWKASLAADGDWRSPGFDDHAWPDAIEPRIKPVGQPWPMYPAVRLRRDFHLTRPVRSARLYATALGAYEAQINGRRVDDRRLAPESTDTANRVLYQAYDVTALLRAGDNAIGVWVGDGWYGGKFSASSRFSFGPAPCRVLAQLEITYEDGARETIGTGPGWSIGPSPIVSSGLYDGEVYDARLEQPGWADPGFKGPGWRPAEIVAAPSAAVEPQQCPPIRVT